MLKETVKRLQQEIAAALKEKNKPEEKLARLEEIEKE